MGKSSKGQRLRAAQPAAPDKGWCDHCLDLLHDTSLSAVADAIRDDYSEMREAGCSHAGAVDGLAEEVNAVIAALRSSGEQYHRDGEIEYGEGAVSEEEFNAWDARRQAREARRTAEAFA